MNNKSAWQEKLFVALGIAGLAGTWAQVGGYFDAGFLAGNINFWKETVVSPASTFILVDLFVLAAAVFVLMFSEGRRVGIAGKWLWTYFLGSTLIGISCFVPFFLAHRQYRLRTAFPDQNVSPDAGGLVAASLSILLALGMVVYSLTHMPA